MDVLETNGIRITVESKFRPDHSIPSNDIFVFSYRISIQNHRKDAVQLLQRSWQITDSNGIKRKVRGEGVIGIQPIIAPGAVHEYESACDLQTDMGTMVGFYQMKNLENQELFNVYIPKFMLQVPFKLN